MNMYENCPFCEVGQYNRALAFRIFKKLSRKEMREVLKHIEAIKKTDLETLDKLMGMEGER